MKDLLKVMPGAGAGPELELRLPGSSVCVFPQATLATPWEHAAEERKLQADDGQLLSCFFKVESLTLKCGFLETRGPQSIPRNQVKGFPQNPVTLWGSGHRSLDMSDPAHSMEQLTH